MQDMYNGIPVCQIYTSNTTRIATLWLALYFQQYE